LKHGLSEQISMVKKFYVVVCTCTLTTLRVSDAFFTSHSQCGSLISSVSTSDLRATSSPWGIAPYVPPPKTITKEEVRALFNRWDEALATSNPRVIANLYSDDPLLLATSDIPRTDYESIMDYFRTFVLLQPRGKILEVRTYLQALTGTCIPTATASVAKLHI
jgi:hypothetical protein